MKILPFILLIIFIIFVRHIVLKYFPNIIINGYFCIFLIIFLLNYICTQNSYYSLLISSIIVFGRLFYRKYIGNETLTDSNHKYHLIIFVIGLVFVFLCLLNYNQIQKYSKYYSYFLFITILGILYNLTYNHTSCCLP